MERCMQGITRSVRMRLSFIKLSFDFIKSRKKGLGIIEKNKHIKQKFRRRLQETKIMEETQTPYGSNQEHSSDQEDKLN